MALDSLIEERIKKIKKIRMMGVNPYPYKYERSHNIGEVLKDFENLVKKEITISTAGRIKTKRHHGKSSFAHIMDQNDSIQIYVKWDEVGNDKYSLYNLLEPGDIIGVKGKIFKTKTEEITIFVNDFELLTKILRPLPDKWHGLKDTEIRYRQRYLDLIMNPEVREVFITRAKIISIMRRILDSKKFLEVETPILQPLYGGALAKPFSTYFNALGNTFYLRIADELYLKRLIAGGFEGVYEFAKDFRNEGMDRMHNPEFTMLEAYWAYKDYNDIMDLTEEFFVTIAKELKGGYNLKWLGKKIDLTPPWPRKSMLDLIHQHAGVNIRSLSDKDLSKRLEDEYKNKLSDGSEELANAIASLEDLNRGNMIDEIFKLAVEPNLLGPIFITDYPKEISPLAKIHRKNPEITERFELYICSQEFANAFSELNDPIDQRERFEMQSMLIEKGDKEAHPLDEDFLRAIEYGMPPTGGLGIGIDRLTMLFTDSSSIQDVILFPHMRPKN